MCKKGDMETVEMTRERERKKEKIKKGRKQLPYRQTE
jgi:hypothetical protein